MPVILVTNDDGINAAGLQTLIKHLSDIADLIVVAPESQRSGESKSLTFQAPLRAKMITGTPHTLAISGTPADAVVLGCHLTRRKYGQQQPDLVVSGINAGDNTSIHALLTSGTCAAAFEAAIMGIPAIAFSKVVQPSEFFENGNQEDYEIAGEIAKDIVEKTLKNKLPAEIAFLNVNFPEKVTRETPKLNTTVSPIGYTVDVQEITDPRGTSVYWVWGPMKEEFAIGTDIHTILIEKKVSISPIHISISAPISSISHLELES